MSFADAIALAMDQGGWRARFSEAQRCLTIYQSQQAPEGLEINPSQNTLLKQELQKN